MSENTGRLKRTAAAVRQRLWGTPRDWINPRRKRFWALSLLLLYTLTGFFIVPWVAKQQIIDRVGELVDRPVTLEALHVNPFVLSVEARDFAITENDATGLLSFERLYVNFQLSSLFRWALTFREITLEHPSLAFVRFADGRTNLGQLLVPAESTPAQPAEVPADPDAGLLRVIVDEFNLVGGGGTFTDQVPDTDFVQAIGPINVSIRDISTLPEDSGRQRVAVRIGNELDVAWQGSLQIEPVHSAGRLTASGEFLPLAYRYFQDQVDVQVTDGTVDLGFDYEVALDDAGTFRAAVTELQLDVREVRVTQADRAIVDLPELRLEGGHLAYPAQQLGARRVSVAAPALLMWREADGTSNVEQIVTPAPTSESATAADDNASTAGAWSLSLERFEVSDLQFDFEDRTLRDPDPIGISDFDLSLENLDNAPDSRFPLTVSFNSKAGGRVTLDGAMGALPAPYLDAELTVDDLALGVAQPYLNDLAVVKIDGGVVSTSTRLAVSAEEPLSATGQLSVDGLSIASTQPEERLVGWQRLGVNEFNYSHAAGALEISQVSVSEPYARLLIAEDRTTNFQQLMRQPEIAPETATDTAAETTEGNEDSSSPAAPVKLTIGRVAIDGGSADFSDLSLPLPFRTSISALEGEMSTLDSSSAEPSQVRLDGQIEDFGLARIQGALMPLGITRNTDIELLFRNVALPDLTPYTIRFAGRRVADGRMEVDLRYQVKDGRMTGQNNVVISDLELGERVEHPDAFDLPLNLAIALLKGPDGRINMDIPVEGDVNDPQFQIGGVIAGAVANVITSIVSSPFRLLGRLVGMESEEFDRVEFEPGSAALTPPERQKLSKLGEALNMRPQLALQVTGVVDPDADRRALQTLATRARIDAALAERSDDEDSPQTMLGERRREAMEALFAADFPETSLADVRGEFRQPAAEDGANDAAGLDETAYVAELEQRLIDAAPVDEAQVQALGRDRAQRVSDWLVENADIDPARITQADTATTSADAGWIAMELEVTAT